MPADDRASVSACLVALLLVVATATRSRADLATVEPNGYNLAHKWKLWGRCDKRGASPGECHVYNRGGTSGIHYYACCNNCVPGDPS
eukprot:CAMPEP_0203810418 /NCGR_PEP_ID=MMETSP0115-20131106/2935_1 /ASSEMBLY_ACC=CAM_ASM_000227 /TAXON_ID=33651 /ORGANISM="Bicosoecid sp, Strain ms1" /LENGTH=86 /DNA_ID=CAMNT_0050719215 /DNA_START=300 /DNA_END=557 /DNA_ORIENTATION=+